MGKKKYYPIDIIRRIPKEKLSASEKLVLIILSEYRNCDSIYVSAKRIAEEASLSESTVLSVFKSLRIKGILKMRCFRNGQRFLYEKELNAIAIENLAKQETLAISLDDIENT